MATVICHFYNEEMLLPYWLRHHTNLFEEGIMINYASTDKSIELIKDMAPKWKIIDSRNSHFGSNEIDAEVKDIEESVSGWKMVLNVTEFLMIPNLDDYIKQFEYLCPDYIGVRAESVFPFDRPEEIGKPFDNTNLWEQRTFGLFESEAERKYGRWGFKHRLLHKAKNGAYTIGRHMTHHDTPIDDELFLFCISYGILALRKQRNIQISARIPESDKQRGLGAQHRWNEQEIENVYNKELSFCVELLNNPKYKEAIERLKNV